MPKVCCDKEIVAAFCIDAQYGGFAEAKQSLKPDNPSFYSVPSSEGMLMMFAYAMGACAFTFNPFCITRIYAAKNYNSVKLAFIVICVMEFIIKLPGMLIGIQGKTKFNDDEFDGGSVFSEVTFDLMDNGTGLYIVMSLLLVAAMAAIMSTADSCLMSLTNITTNDLGRGLLGKTPPQLSMKVLMVVAMGLAIGLSYVFDDLTNLFILQNSLLMVGVAPAFVCGLYCPTLHPGALLCGTVSGLLVAFPFGFGGMGKAGEGNVQTAGNTMGLLVLIIATVVFHNLEKSYPDGTIAAFLEQFAYMGKPKRAHQPKYDDDPINSPGRLGELLEGLQEPFSGFDKAGCGKLLWLALLELMFIPWYLEPGSAAGGYVDGIPNWAFTSLMVSVVGGISTVTLALLWKDPMEEREEGDAETHWREGEGKPAVSTTSPLAMAATAFGPQQGGKPGNGDVDMGL